MIPLRIAGANMHLTAPRGRPDVRDLDIIITEGCCISRWEPLPEELAVLNAGGSVELHVMGAQPPVYLGVAEHPAARDDTVMGGIAP